MKVQMWRQIEEKSYFKVVSDPLTICHDISLSKSMWFSEV